MPVDVYGLRLSTSATAAAAYRDAQDAWRHVQDGAREALERAWRDDPGFALAAAGLALDDHAHGRTVAARDWAERAAGATRLNEREASHVHAVGRQVAGEARPMIQHLREFPGDCVALHHTVPTVGAPGLPTFAQHTWAVAERAAGAYGSDWWYASLLAYVRQEQRRWDEAYDLADGALAQDASAGQAAHARAHVAYETGGHVDGLAWLDGWLTGPGQHVSTRSHFSWHAALHELALGRYDAMQQRYLTELAPPAVSGERVLIDSCSLLWRAQLTPEGPAAIDRAELLDAFDEELLRRPESPFTAMHAAIACCVLDDEEALDDLITWSEGHSDPTFATVVAPLARGLGLLRQGHASRAADELLDVRRRSARLGGSAPQRDVIDDTLVAALLAAERLDEAEPLLDARADRRPVAPPARPHPSL